MKQSLPLMMRKGVVIPNVLLASGSILSAVYFFVYREFGLVFFVLVYPSFLWYMQHRCQMGFIRVIQTMMGLSRDGIYYKKYLKGVAIGWLKGWPIMIKNAIEYVQMVKKQRDLNKTTNYTADTSLTEFEQAILAEIRELKSENDLKKLEKVVRQYNGTVETNSPMQLDRVEEEEVQAILRLTQVAIQNRKGR